MWAGAVAWQIGYDTAYAYVDVREDKRLGLKSTAILFGSRGLLGTAEMSAMGQQTNSMLTFITAEKVPAGAWAVIKARGRLWDVVGEPIRSPRMKITRVILRARDPEPAYARY